jgi:CrcB protein
VSLPGTAAFWEAGHLERWYQVGVLSVGGVAGVNARYWLGVVLTRWAGSQFPWATFTINVTGSFAIGLVSVLLARWLPHPHARLLVVVGFLGGYTTFSSFSFESLALWERGEWGPCIAYMAGSVTAGFAAVVLGTALGRELTLERPERAAATDTITAPEALEQEAAIMIPTDARLLSIHVGADARHQGKRLFEAIVETARALKLAGASVFTVELSYGSHQRIHDALSDYSSTEMPVVIEIVDGPERIEALLTALGAAIAPAMVTIEPVHVVRYWHREA